MLTIAITLILFIYLPMLVLFPCYPPLISGQHYECGAPGPSTFTDYAVIDLVGGMNSIVFWQNI